MKTTRQWGLMAATLVIAGCAGGQQQRQADWLKVAHREAIAHAQLADRVRSSRIVILGETHALIEPIETLRMLLSETNRNG